MKKPLISPSLQCADPLALGDAALKMARAGADMLHIDLMDMHFVPNLALNFDLIAALKRTVSLPIDTHIMARSPREFVLRSIQAGTALVCWHVESQANHHALLDEARAQGAKVGLALSPQTPVEALREYLPLLDFVLIMGVRPGFAGQSFLPETYGRIERLSQMRNEDDLAFSIEVDGGLDVKCSKACLKCGADTLVAGALSVFKPCVDLENEARMLIRSLSE